MKNKVADTIKEYGMLSSGEKILVGFSGGADSTALLLVLKELGYEVSACHVNHCLRGEESERDEQFCRKLCKDYGIKLLVEKIDVNTFCIENKLGTEEGARILRYKALEKNAGGGKIATAHNLNDCLETMLINLSRGTALRGLCGVPPVRGNIIRPLIECTRLEIEKYLSEKGQSFVTDSTNLSVDYTRNRIRHNVIPELMKINSGLMNSYRRTRNNLLCEEEYLDALADKVLSLAMDGSSYRTDELKLNDDVIIRRCVAKLLKEKNLSCSADMVESICEIVKNGGKINISNDVYAYSSRGRISICTIQSKRVYPEVVVESGGTYHFGDKIISLLITHSENVNKHFNVNNLLANTNIDYDKIQGKVVLRNRRPGDKIRLCRRNFTSSVKKLFNRDVPLEKRDDIVFLADDEGVIFIEGYGIDSRVAVCDSTENVLTVEIIKGE